MDGEDVSAYFQLPPTSDFSNSTVSFKFIWELIQVRTI